MYPTSNGAGASNGYTSSSRHPASARSSSGYRNDRSRSPVRGNDLNQSSSNSTSAAQSQTKRNSKACENCRTRRVKCQGGQPCLACVEVGLSERCAVRAKARPNRLPKVAGEIPRISEEPTSSTSNPAAFISSVEHALERWTAGKGYPMNLSLSDSFPLRASFLRPLPSIEVDPHRETSYVDGFLTMLHYFDFIRQDQLHNILDRYHKDPDAVEYDEKALLFACFCLGRYREITITDLDTPDRSDADWFRRSVVMLDQCSRPTLTSLRALHCLHMHSMRAGGVPETRDILGRMASHVRELGLHRDIAIKNNPEEEKLEKMLFGTLYKDSWYATICDQPPFLRWSEIDHDLSSVAVVPKDLDGGPDAVPFLVQLTVFENDLLIRLHSGSIQLLLTEYVLDAEARWDKWTKAFREEQGRVSRPMLYIYANIRFHWIRLMLRFPCLSNPYLAQSSLAILARSVTHIIQSYAASIAIQRFTASWPDLRRIVTCGQLAVLLYDQGELIKPELETLFQTIFNLLSEIRPLCPMAADATNSFRQIIRILRLTVSMPNGEDATTPQADLPFLFDYSLPPPFEQWIFPMAPNVPSETEALKSTDQEASQYQPRQADFPPDTMIDGQQTQNDPFITDPNEAAAYLNLLASLQASEAFPGASQF